ncbi:DNA helicase [Tanacetum coccineum]
MSTRSRTRWESAVSGDGLNIQPRAWGPPLEYNYTGSCAHSCQHCGTLFWYKERLRNNARGECPRYNRCCKGGRVALRTYQIYPEYIKMLLEDRHFLENIRAYNQMFNMTSLGANIDESINNGHEPYYIYDTHTEVDNRMSHFGEDNSVLRRDIVEGLIDLLDTHNALVQLFRTARKKFEDTHIPNFKVRLYNVIGAREYELPTGYMLGAIDGYSKELTMIGATRSSSEQKRVTMKAYYSYYLHDRANHYNYLSRTGRLFQQYVGDINGSDCGSRLILPQPFTVLYTVEFQKRGLPQCHTLLWIDEFVRICIDEDIDAYISAELPPEHQDPECYRIVSEFMMHGPCGLANPSASWDLFYQRMLLCHQKGYTSFPAIRTVNDFIYLTCRAACEALGLLEDDQEWETTLQEAALTATPVKLRTLLAHILTFCQVSDPLEGCLNNCSKSLTDFGLRLPPEHLMSFRRNKLLMEERIYDRRLLAIERDRLLPKLNDKQRHIFNLIIDACLNNKQQLVFVYDHGGIGKTFLWKTIIYALRSEGKIVLAVASSGIASLLLTAGWTTHSCFKIPIDPTDTTIGTPDESDPENTSWIDIPDKYYIPDDENGISNLIKTRMYISYDDAIPHDHDGGEVELLYPKEYLNTLSFTSLPPHRLELKVGTPIMLLRNVNIVSGLCNGTRLIVTQLLSKVGEDDDVEEAANEEVGGSAEVYRNISHGD